MSDEEEQFSHALDQLKMADDNPWVIIKTAFSYLPVILLIGSGIVLNWILAFMFLFGYATITPFTTTIICLLILMILLPAAYFFVAYRYGQEAFVYEVYKEIVRPILGNLLAKALNKILNDDSTPTTSANIKEELEKESGSFLDKIPTFIKDRLAIFTVINDIIKLASERYQDGSSKENAKSNIVAYVFELMDARMETIANPSLKNFFIVAGINLVTVSFIF
jgi:hypothetical protein